MPASHVSEDRLLAQLVNLTVQNSVATYVAAGFNAGVMSFMVYDLLPPSLVFGWFATLMAVNTIRLAITHYYLGQEWPVEHALRWYRIISAGVVLTALIWSAGVWLFFPVDSPVARTFVALIAAGVIAGGVSVLSALREVATVWVVLLIVPIMYHAFAFGGLRWSLFGMTCVMFLLHHTVAVMNAHRRIVDSVRLAFENEELVATLFRSKRALEVARDVAVQAAQAKSAFLANMSHEIRTPMTSILGYADLMRETASLADAQTYTQAIQRSGKHLLVIINDILDFSKIDAGKMTLERIACDPAQVIEFALDMMAERAREKGLALRRELRAPFPRTLLSDPVRLQQILVNLLSNAIKFTEQGEVCLEAFAERKDENGRLCLRVRDTGIGISGEQLDQLFRPFTQADASITRRYGGTGLGLSISHRLAGLLGGSLSATSEIGRGSCFELALDLGPWDELELGAPQVAAPVAVVATGTRRFRGRVLLAEDGRDNQRLITTLLERRGLAVDIVENGRDAVEQASSAWTRGTPHDLILMDVQMPEMDGMTATRELKRRGYPKPIVALTAQVLEGDRQACLEAGYDDYETKPINLKRLDQLLGRYVAVDDSAA